MSQTLHICQKDIHYLWLEICVFAVLSAGSAWIEIHSPDPTWIQGLLMIAAVYLIARLILAEAIPGDSQYWITRPYRWKNLLAAKILFIIIFVNLPILLARLVTLLALGFSFKSSIPGLLWSELLVFFASVTVAALAALTASFVSFTFSLVILLAIILALHETSLWPESFLAARSILESMQWFWDSILAVILVMVALCILCTQYMTRRTMFSRFLGVYAVVLSATAYLFVPWSWALFLQNHLSRRSINTSSMRLEITPNPQRLSLNERNLVPMIDFLISVSGVPNNAELRGDALSVVLNGSDGKIWKSGSYRIPGLSRKVSSADRTIFDAMVPVDRRFFQQELGRSITLHASIYLTLFGNGRGKTVELQGAPVNVMDGMQCYLAEFHLLRCRSPFRWPDRIVYAKFSENDVRSFSTLISYSPFPASLNFGVPIETRELSAPPSLRQVTILAEQPLEHFTLDFEIRSIRIEDFAVTK